MAICRVFLILPRVKHGAGLLRRAFRRERIYAFLTRDCLPERQVKGSLSLHLPACRSLGEDRVIFEQPEK